MIETEFWKCSKCNNKKASRIFDSETGIITYRCKKCDYKLEKKSTSKDLWLPHY